METMMRKADEAFFSDSGYELELNLQKVRRELIGMIEAFERKDCNICKRLKCRCTDPDPQRAATVEPAEAAECASTGLATDDAFGVDVFALAPAAGLLPKPIWGEKGTLRPHRSESPAESVGSGSLDWSDTEPALAAAGGRRTIDAFFHSFRRPPTAGALANAAFASTQLAAALQAAPNKARGYTYF